MSALDARLIIEILGKPADHVTFTMNALVDKLGQEKGVHITHKKIHDPRAVEGSKELFTTFVELEISFDSINAFFGIMFAYMPSNVEILSPMSFKLSNEEVTSLANTLISRLHLYESVTKKLVGDRDILINKLKSMGVTFSNQPPQPAPVSEEKKAPQKKSKKKSGKKR